MKTIHCPICQNPKFYNSNCPNEICKKCVGRATDGHGRYVRFHNRTISTGCIAFYLDADGKEEYCSTLCYVSKQKCRAKADKFGGVVIELLHLKDKNG